MKRKHFLVLIIILIIGLFSIAYAETVASISEPQVNQTVAPTPIPVKTVVVAPTAPPTTAPPIVAAAPVPVPTPAPPVAPKALPRKGEMISWWDGGNQAFPAGQEVTVVDVRTGKSFNAMRTYGHNHADMETITNEDTLKMLEIWGGSWSWDRRPVVVICNGREIAASAAGMPHAGIDKYTAESYVDGRSGGFGHGMNLDKVKNNGMDGHFDIHLLDSKTHGSNKVDSKHQAMIRIAGGL